VTDKIYAIVYGAVANGGVYDVDGTLGYSFGNGLKLQGTLAMPTLVSSPTRSSSTEFLSNLVKA
jgi:hypothetical protein